VAFEAADRFEFGFALGLLAVEIGLGLGVSLRAADGDDVDRAVELAITAAVQPVTLGLARAGGDWCGSGMPGEVPVGRESFGAGGATDDDRGSDRPAPRLCEQLRSVSVDQGSELCDQRALFADDLGDALEDQPRDPQSGAGLQPVRARGPAQTRSAQGPADLRAADPPASRARSRPGATAAG
jgi:hypothetical protein